MNEVCNFFNAKLFKPHDTSLRKLKQRVLGFFLIFTAVEAKKISVLFFKLVLISIMLLKPVLVSSYLLQNSDSGIVLELSEGEEDKSEKTSFELNDEILHSTSTYWNNHVGFSILKKLVNPETDMEEHIREIVPPPPQA